MFIVTQNDAILNMDKTTHIYLAHYKGNKSIVKCQMEGFDFDIYEGTKEDAEGAFYTIKEGLIKGAAMVDFTPLEGINND